MRTQMDLRARRACAAAVVVGFAYAVPAALPASAQDTLVVAPAAPPPSAAAPVLPAHLVGPAAVDYRGRVSVAGRLGPGGAGVALALQFRATTSSTWQSLGSTRAGRTGAYRLSAVLGHSGALRVAVPPSAGAATALGSGPIPGSVALGSDQVLTSSPMAIAVRAGVALSSTRLTVFGGGRATVAGAVDPSLAGVAVALEVRSGHAWRVVARARSIAGGRYRLTFAPRSAGRELARIEVGADGVDEPGVRRIAPVNAFRLAEASWYGPGGTTACGQQLTGATLGVANKTLACGTLVTLRYGSRTVRVPVIDRGPYVAGREFDLTAATKQALGFGDLGAVWTTAP